MADSEAQILSIEGVHDKEDISQPQPKYPEGGFKGWAVVLGGFLAMFCGFGYTASFAVYQDYYTRIYLTSENAPTISWIGSINSFVVLVSGVFIGRLYDKGYFYHLICGGAMLITFSLFMLSLAKQNRFYQIFLAQGIGHGLGTGCMYIPSLAIVAQYFQRRRALAMAVVTAGAPLGSIIHPIMFNNTFESIGFGNTVRANAGMITGLLVITCAIMHPRLPPSAELPQLSKVLRKLAKDKAYGLASLSILLFSAGIFFPSFYIQLDAIQHGLDKHFAFYSPVIINAAGITGRLVPALLVKPIGIIPLVIFAAGAGSIITFTFACIETVAGFIIFGILYGFVFGMFVSLSAPFIAALGDDPKELGLRIGIGLAFAGVGSLIGPPMQGSLLKGQYVWWKSAVLAGILCWMSFITLLAMALALRGQRQEVGQGPRTDGEKVMPREGGM